MSICFPAMFVHPEVFLACALTCSGELCSSLCDYENVQQSFEYAATFEQMQTLAIDFCNEYPEECQQAFDAWVESFDTEAEE